MAPFAQARIVLEANAAAPGKALQFPQELAPSHIFSVAQICANRALLERIAGDAANDDSPGVSYPLRSRLPPTRRFGMCLSE